MRGSPMARIKATVFELSVLLTKSTRNAAEMDTTVGAWFFGQRVEASQSVESHVNSSTSLLTASQFGCVRARVDMRIAA
ncbi:hypothetical protein TIFTF001_025786 [Ficus carica]|uniref:Uncharacterized protein n=1 Tax=Ficus carica TaxID=3494 RepID=A0AA88AKH1_FICCA|nr:hypothetical protein TIFTF001_025786 [Ficus carica]